MSVARPTTTVNQFSAVYVCACQLHSRRAHSRECETHPLVDAVHGLQEGAEVASGRADHSVVPAYSKKIEVSNSPYMSHC